MSISLVRSPLKYVGGKSAAAARIVATFPVPTSYTTYHEPCGGAAHVLFAKPSYGHREVLNDVNNDLVNFWLQVQDHAEELAAQLQALPYSRHLYYSSHKRLFDGSTIDPLERTALYFYVLRGTATGWIRESPGGWNNTVSNAAAYYSMLDLFKQVQQRLTTPRRVIIDNRDIERVLEEYDGPSTLHYVDPPYIGAEYYYQAGYRKQVRKPFDHARLAAILNQVQGMVTLSYYPHADLDCWYPADRWHRITWQQQKPSVIPALGSDSPEENQPATEMLLCNYPTKAGTCSLWDDLECVKLILPWSTPSMRFCTSELKTAIICRDLVARFPGCIILSASGLRRQESPTRALAPICTPQTKLTNKTLGTQGYDWHPILSWTREQVLEYHQYHGFPLHEAYTKYGMSRVSCAYCILASLDDLMASATNPDNHDIYREMVTLEIRSGFSFQSGRWLGDVAPHLLSAEMLAGLKEAKRRAALREQVERRIPAHLQYVKGWPTIMPTREEAVLLSEIRRTIADIMQLSLNYTDPDAILERYAELMAKNAAKPGKTVTAAVVAPVQMDLWQRGVCA